MEGILVCVQGQCNEMRVSYPENGVIQLNYSTLSDLNFTSYNQSGQIVSQFIINNILAMKVCTKETILQMDSYSTIFTLQCLIREEDHSVLVSTQNSNIITVHILDQMLFTYKPNLETIPEEHEDQSLKELSKKKQSIPLPSPSKHNKTKKSYSISEFHPQKVDVPKYKQKVHVSELFDKENIKNRSNKKVSPNKKVQQSPISKQNKKTIDSTTRTKRVTNKQQSPPQKHQSFYSPNSERKRRGTMEHNRQDPVDILLAQLISQNNRKKGRKQKTQSYMRPKIDSEGMIDRQWLEEEMINEDL